MNKIKKDYHYNLLLNKTIQAARGQSYSQVCGFAVIILPHVCTEGWYVMDVTSVSKKMKGSKRFCSKVHGHGRPTVIWSQNTTFSTHFHPTLSSVYQFNCSLKRLLV